MSRPTVILVYFLLSALTLVPAAADISDASDDCNADLIETTPSSEFSVVADGSVVRHDRTGLEWKRCPEGMDWTGSECSGSLLTMSWKAALQHATNIDGDWRLPNVRELRSILERCRHGPSVNTKVFPNTPGDYFWSASPSVRHSDRAWRVYFRTGVSTWPVSKVGDHGVRLVRGGS